MKDQEKFVNFLCKLFVIGIIGILCFYIYHLGTGHEKARFALTLCATTYMLLCFYNAVIKNMYKRIAEKVLSGLIIIAFSNELYDYNKLTALFPIFKSIDPLLFSLILLGTALSLLIIIKIIIYVYENSDVNGTQSSGHSPANTSSNNIKIYTTENKAPMPKPKKNNTWMVLCFTFLIIFIGAGGAFFTLLHNGGIFNNNYDFFETVSSMLNYAGSIVMVFLAIFLVIIFLIEMLRLIISLYLLSTIVDIVVCYLTYKFTGINLDSFYNFVNEGKYLALPLIILFVGVAFVIFLRLTHATLVLLVDMKPENIKLFLHKVNSKTQITERVVDIIKAIIDIVLDTLLTALKFVSFIPCFFKSIYAFVLEDEEDFEFIDDEDEVER